MWILCRFPHPCPTPQPVAKAIWHLLGPMHLPGPARVPKGISWRQWEYHISMSSVGLYQGPRHSELWYFDIKKKTVKTYQTYRSRVARMFCLRHSWFGIWVECCANLVGVGTSRHRFLSPAPFTASWAFAFAEICSKLVYMIIHAQICVVYVRQICVVYVRTRL